MDTTLDVLALLPFDEAQRSTLEAATPQARVTYATHDTVTDEQISAAHVIVGNLAPERLSCARNLRLLQLNSAGYDKYVTPGLMPQGAQLASASGAYGQAVSEHMFAMLLALMKRLPSYRDDQRAHVWTDHGPATSLAGANVLVLGAGDIGGHFARLVSAMGATAAGVRRHGGELPQGFAAMRTMDALPELLPEADVVASFLPSTPETRGLVDAAFLAQLKQGAWLVNGGRGDLVVEADLVAALEAGTLAGAALDVTVPEPLPVSSPLWDAPGALITPHVSGGFHLPVVLTNIARIAAENVAHVAAGEEPRNLVRL